MFSAVALPVAVNLPNIARTQKIFKHTHLTKSINFISYAKYTRLYNIKFVISLNYRFQITDAESIENINLSEINTICYIKQVKL